MAKLIIIFDGAPGKAMPPHALTRNNRRSNSDDCVQLAVAGDAGGGSAVLAGADGDQRSVSRGTRRAAGGSAEGIAGGGGGTRCNVGACCIGGRGSVGYPTDS